MIIMAVAVPVISAGTEGGKEETGQNEYVYRESAITKIGESFTFGIVDGKLAFSRDGAVTWQTDKVGAEAAFIVKSLSPILVTFVSSTSYQANISFSNTVTYDSSVVWTVSITESGVRFENTGGYSALTSRGSYATYPDVNGSLALLKDTDPWLNVGKDVYVAFTDQVYDSNTKKWKAGTGGAYGQPWNGDSLDIATLTYDIPATTEIAAENGEAKQLGGLTSSDTTKVKDIIITAVVAPIEYTIESGGGGDSTVNTLVNLIPMLMIVGLMIAVVAAYIQFKGE